MYVHYYLYISWNVTSLQFRMIILGGKYISILLYNTTNKIFDYQLKRYVFEKK